MYRHRFGAKASVMAMLIKALDAYGDTGPQWVNMPSGCGVWIPVRTGADWPVLEDGRIESVTMTYDRSIST